VRDFERDFFSKFTKEGYDVYLYDQPGAGFSDILKLNEYTMHRYVEDIEAIRKEIGAEKIILIGQSFGGMLGSSYVTAYPNNVEKTIFTSPGPLSNKNVAQSSKPRNAGNIIKPYTPSLAENIRMVTAILLVKYVNKETAENFVSQKELIDFTSRMFPQIFAESFPESYSDKIPKLKCAGLNLLSNIALISDYYNISANVIEKVKKVNIPILILRSEYDYVPWEDTREYRELYPNSKLVYIKESGHLLWAVNDKDTYISIRAFLLNETLTLPNYTGNENPATLK
jgi:proline iminopeptidase